jgi:hypothetical protein
LFRCEEVLVKLYDKVEGTSASATETPKAAKVVPDTPR